MVEEQVEEEEVVEEEVSEPQAQESQDDDMIMKINERLSDIENRLPRMDISMSNLKKEIDGLRDEMKKIEESMKDMMALYEVVSAQINPFVGSSKATKLSFERIDELEKKIEEFEELILDLQMDIRMIYRSAVNLKEVVNEVLYEGVISFE
ncbi:MAG: flagellar protein FlaC [Archaeoglobi archaeon]|uniref:flagella accessory protein C n=1 Tax=Geoglobus ahangari TaxID=113653 RepID=UPI00146FEB45|nr:flagella accessory protein C [Geoglobus ahangari]NOY11548.1 flagellar protein FlaC [Archaeoglobi archaeon]